MWSSGRGGRLRRCCRRRFLHGLPAQEAHVGDAAPRPCRGKHFHGSRRPARSVLQAQAAGTLRLLLQSVLVVVVLSLVLLVVLVLVLVKNCLQTKKKLCHMTHVWHKRTNERTNQETNEWPIVILRFQDLEGDFDVVNSGKLSSLQLEAIAYACQTHETRLPNGCRAGFFIGDGAGVRNRPWKAFWFSFGISIFGSLEIEHCWRCSL